MLSYALFPQVAEKFIKYRDNPHKDEPAPAPAKAADDNGTRTGYVDASTTQWS